MERRRREDDGLKDNDATSSNSTLLPALIDGKRNLASWNFIRGIGIGQFGSVVVVQQKEMTPPEAALETREDQTTKEVSSRAFAMKCIGKMKVIAEDAVHRTVQELRVLSRIDHPFVIKLESAFQDESNLYLITELCEGGNLEALLANHHSVGVATVRFLMGQLLLALEHVHGMGVVHMDVNPGNCLLDSVSYKLKHRLPLHPSIFFVLFPFPAWQINISSVDYFPLLLIPLNRNRKEI
mmetsp:Transcript_19277/g.37223  ORF Transcript_19277/g.37223 Transcript_19277/m.37223 type:complete len:239 (+) Transcript_19277:107-823(+)